MVASAEKAERVHEQHEQLKRQIQKLIGILQESKMDTVGFDRSDCGQAKQRRVTSSQRVYSLGLDYSGWDHFFIQ